MIAAMIQMWQNVLGVDIKSDGVEIGKLIDALTATANNPGGLQFWVAGWGADYPDPQEFLTLQFDKDSPFNIGNYGQNSSADAAQQQATQQLLEHADANLDRISNLVRAAIE